MKPRKRIVVVGAGIGGLSAALRLAHAGAEVTVVEAQAGPGGKMRTVPSPAGPIDAGPTVLTLRPVFDALFADVGARIGDHVTLIPEPILARHFWTDGTTLDLHASADASADAVAATFGTVARRDYLRFMSRARRLFDGFDGAMMQAATPNLGSLTAHVLRNPRLIGAMAPTRTLSALLRHHFREPRLAQLFGRYATYVGGAPDDVPALLALICEAEARGVWRVQGGMHRLAQAIEALARQKGATFLYKTPVDRIDWQGGRAAGVDAGGRHIAADAVLFNGDPAALASGALGAGATGAVAGKAHAPRSLSAHVASFAATVTGPPLAHHTVLFGDDPGSEFADLAAGRMPRDPTLYICAQDRGHDQVPPALERFEIILNAAPLGTADDPGKGAVQCLDLMVTRLDRFGLRFTPPPTAADLATPHTFASLFPQSQGALYGRSPKGMLAAFHRPTVRSRLRGLYLVGGGVHPGAGVPMATLCARHAAEAIMADLGLTSTSDRTATRGGTSTASRTMAAAPSRSSVS